MMMEGLIIDLDGVITKDKKLNIFEDAPDFINFLKKKNINFIIATNNSLFTPEEILQKLKEQGVEINEENLITPLIVLPKYLKERNLSKLYVIGSDNLKKYLTEKGFNILENQNAEAVIIGIDKKLSFEKLKVATTAAKENNAEILSLNANLIAKDDDGLLFPGVGCIGQMIGCATKKEWKHLGKNSELYNKKLFENFKNLKNVAVISDDIFTDLIPFSKIGLKTVFITTGKYKISDLPKDFKLDIVVNSLKELIKEIENV
jgi:4-nitrophenyl phosphatase